MSYRANGGRLRVLVVEDDHDTARTYSLLLRVWEHDCVTTQDGVTALETAATYHPDVVLLDLQLPELNGLQVARQLRQGPEGDRPLVWIISGFGREQDREKAREAGSDLFLLKPVDPQYLEELLDQAASQKFENELSLA